MSKKQICRLVVASSALVPVTLDTTPTADELKRQIADLKHDLCGAEQIAVMLTAVLDRVKDALEGCGMGGDLATQIQALIASHDDYKARALWAESELERLHHD